MTAVATDNLVSMIVLRTRLGSLCPCDCGSEQMTANQTHAHGHNRLPSPLFMIVCYRAEEDNSATGTHENRKTEFQATAEKIWIQGKRGGANYAVVVSKAG